MPHSSPLPTPGSRVSLDDQLASVVEQDGVSILAADGVRLMRAPTHVYATKSKRSRKKRMAYAARPTVSVKETDRDRDHVADLDRVVVGFSNADAPKIIRHSVPVRAMEHERSPYVVSLRGLALAPAFATVDGRVSSSMLAEHAATVPGEVPQLEEVTSLASDLCVEEEGCGDQFTPTTFQTSFSTSYGWVNQLFLALSSIFTLPSASPRAEQTEAPRTERLSILIPLRLPSLRTAVGVVALLGVATLPASAVRLARSLETGRSAAVAAGLRGVSEAHAAANAPIGDSADALRRASAQFREADQALNSANAIAVGLTTLVPQTRSAFRTGRALAEVGAKTSEAGSVLASGFAAAIGPNGGSPLDRLKTLSAYAESALPLLDDAAEAYRQVDPAAVPEDHRADMEELAARLDDGRTAIREFTGAAELLSAVLGRESSRRYLLIFQNPSELRPTGGFMGSFAEVTLDRGELVRLNVPSGGTYAVQGQLTAVVRPPEPLSLIAERWEFQDSNWSPDFSVAADKIRYFWSKSGGPTMDGIIAVNATFVQQLLALTGPIDLPEFGKTITQENFMIELQKSVELEYDRAENQPKKILGVMAPILLERLKALPQEQAVQLLGIVSQALESKEIQASFSDPDENALAQRFGWSGQLKSTAGDALAIIEANIAGQKTDLSVREAATHSAVIAEDGSIQNTVTLTRLHTASKGELFRGVRNVSYLRFYVPRGSTLLSANGFTPPDASFFGTVRDDAVMDPDEAEHARTRSRHASGLDVWEEGDRTVFGGWSMVDPGQDATLSVSYRLPFNAFDLHARLDLGAGGEEQVNAARRAAYTMLFTSQSGKTDRTITSQVHIPESWKSVWSRQESLQNLPWNQDRVSAVLMEVH